MGLLKFETFPLFILPVIIVVLLVSGLSFGLGSIAVFFRDITQAVGMVLNLVFFLTPIVYPASLVPENLRWLFTLNPFYFIVEISRNTLVRGKLPDLVSVLYPSVFALVIFFSGYYIFERTKEAFKDIL